MVFNANQLDPVNIDPFTAMERGAQHRARMDQFEDMQGQREGRERIKAVMQASGPEAALQEALRQGDTQFAEQIRLAAPQLEAGQRRNALADIFTPPGQRTGGMNGASQPGANQRPNALAGILNGSAPRLETDRITGLPAQNNMTTDTMRGRARQGAQEALQSGDVEMFTQLSEIANTLDDQTTREMRGLFELQANEAARLLQIPPEQRPIAYRQTRAGLAQRFPMLAERLPDDLDTSDTALKGYLARAMKAADVMKLSTTPDAPSGFQFTGGRLEPIPGGPNDPQYLQRAASARRAPERPRTGPPDTRTIWEGQDAVQQEWSEDAGAYVEVGRGERWRERKSGDGGPSTGLRQAAPALQARAERLGVDLEDVRFTAQEEGMTPAEVLAMLEAKKG